LGYVLIGAVWLIAGGNELEKNVRKCRKVLAGLDLFEKLMGL
jgi:hypothetical protein